MFAEVSGNTDDGEVRQAEARVTVVVVAVVVVVVFGLTTYWC